jgi:hypothetical protein
MSTNLQLGTVDVVILVILVILLVLASRIIVGFFKGGKKS